MKNYRSCGLQALNQTQQLQLQVHAIEERGKEISFPQVRMG